MFIQQEVGEEMKILKNEKCSSCFEQTQTSTYED